MGIRGQKPKPHGLRVIRGEASPEGRREPPPFRGGSDRCGGLKDDGTACGLTAGWGTDHVGTGRCRHHPPEEVEEEIAPPSDLPPQLVPAWNEIAPRLLRNAVLTELDVGGLVQLLLARCFAVTAGRTLLEEGVVIQGSKGERKHPAWQIYRDAQTAVRQWYCEFGMTPSARTRLPLGTDDELDELEKLLRGKA